MYLLHFPPAFVLQNINSDHVRNTLKNLAQRIISDKMGTGRRHKPPTSLTVTREIISYYRIRTQGMSSIRQGAVLTAGILGMALVALISKSHHSPLQHPEYYNQNRHPPVGAAQQQQQQQAGNSYMTCPSAIYELCSDETKKQFSIQMVAMPKTASTSTGFLFVSQQTTTRKSVPEGNNISLSADNTLMHATMAPAVRAWNQSASLQERGFSCPHDVSSIAPCGGGEDGSLVSCVLAKLHYKGKKHANYEQLINSTDVLFTTLRDPAQFVLSQFNFRDMFDRVWNAVYPSIPIVSVEKWTELAWWRHNLFTKMLATDTDVIWAHNDYSTTKDLHPSKQESDEQNALGHDSQWLQTALARLREMPFFGLMHRLEESFELFGFYLCFPVAPSSDNDHNKVKEPRQVDPKLARLVETHFRLDAILLQEAETIFDELLADVRQKKERGIMCDLSRVLKEPTVEFGLQCQDVK